MYLSRGKEKNEGNLGKKKQQKQKTQNHAYQNQAWKKKCLKGWRIFSFQLSPIPLGSGRWGRCGRKVLYSENCPFLWGEWEGGEGRESSDHSRHNPPEEGAAEGNQI